MVSRSAVTSNPRGDHRDAEESRRKDGGAGRPADARARPYARAKAASHGWPAGLDAIAKAQQEGVKVFESLLKKGQRFEQKTREAAADTAAAARDTAMAARGAAAAKAKEVQQMAGGTWDKLEQVFEDRVERALSKLGIYTQNDLQRLAERVDELAEAVNRLLAAKGAAPKTSGHQDEAAGETRPYGAGVEDDRAQVTRRAIRVVRTSFRGASAQRRGVSRGSASRPA